MRVRRFRGLRRAAPKYLWFRRTLQGQTGLGSSTGQQVIFNVATDLLQTPTAAIEGQEILLKGFRALVDWQLLTGGAPTVGADWSLVCGFAIEPDTTAAGVTNAIDPSLNTGTTNARRDWMDVWSWSNFGMPAAGTTISVSAQDSLYNNRKVKVSRKLRTEDNLVFAFNLVAVNPASVFGASSTIFFRVQVAALLRTTRPGF